MSVSCTTRKQRKGEVEGNDYHFIDRETFAGMRDRGEFLEWAVVFDNYYGTPRKKVEQALAAGRDVLFDVDWQGAESLRDKAPNDVVSVFILPPSGKALEQRLKERAQDRAGGGEATHARGEQRDPALARIRLRGRSTTTSTSAVAAVRAILAAERLRRSRQTGAQGIRAKPVSRALASPAALAIRQKSVTPSSSARALGSMPRLASNVSRQA